MDLGATAKAWTADSAAAGIHRRTGSGCLVSIGGDIAVAGAAPERGWQVRVADVTGHPSDRPAGPSSVVTLRSGGLATSSIRARRWQRGGLWLHHLIDPRTGLPPVPAWRTVSAAAGSCVGREHGEHRGRRPRARDLAAAALGGLPVRLVTADGRGPHRRRVARGAGGMTGRDALVPQPGHRASPRWCS